MSTDPLRPLGVAAGPRKSDSTALLRGYGAPGRLLQLACGVGAVVLGAGLTGVGAFLAPDTTVAIKSFVFGSGSLLTAGGSLLFSWVIATAVTRRDTRAELNGQLDAISRALAQIYQQIIESVEGAQGENISPDTSLALISQAANMIFGQVAEIQAIRGADFEGGPLISTKAALDDIARVLRIQDDRFGESAPGHELRAAVETARARVSRAVGLATYVKEDVACPSCAAIDAVLLGTGVGSTATHDCRRCNQRFNVHVVPTSQPSLGPCIRIRDRQARACQAQLGAAGPLWSLIVRTARPH